MRTVLVFIVKNWFGVSTNGGGSAPLCPLDLVEEVAQVILKQAGSLNGEIDALAVHGFGDALIPQTAAFLQGLGQSCDLVAGDRYASW